MRGRLRIKVPGARGDAALLDEIRGKLLAASGISEVRCSPITGSLLIHHDDGVDPLPIVGAVPHLALCATARFAAVSTSAWSDQSGAERPDMVALVAKMLPLAFSGHAAGPLIDILAEPILRAAVDTMQPQWEQTWAIVEEPEERGLALAA